MKPKNLRVSIKNHNQVWLERIAAQMEVSDMSEVVNYLLLELKSLGYSFNANYAAPVQSPFKFEQSAVQPEQLAHSALAYTGQFDFDVELARQTDPIIERIAALVDTF